MIKFHSCLNIFIVVLELSSVLGGPESTVDHQSNETSVRIKVEPLGWRSCSSKLPVETLTPGGCPEQIDNSTQSSYTKCSMQDSKCLTSEGQKFVRTFVNGIPESRVEKLDDMFIESIQINTDGVDHELQNVKITGLKNAKINDISFDNNFKLMRVSFDANLTANFEYTLDGVLFRQPISGTGTATIHIKNIQVDMLILFDIIETENGKHRMNVKRHRSGFTIKTGVEYDYSNFYNGDKKKHEAFHDVLNKNWVTVTSVFGDKFYYAILDTIYEAIKTFTRSHDLEDLLSFP